MTALTTAGARPCEGSSSSSSSGPVISGARWRAFPARAEKQPPLALQAPAQGGEAPEHRVHRPARGRGARRWKVLARGEIREYAAAFPGRGAMPIPRDPGGCRVRRCCGPCSGCHRHAAQARPRSSAGWSFFPRRSFPRRATTSPSGHVERQAVENMARDRRTLIDTDYFREITPPPAQVRASHFGIALDLGGPRLRRSGCRSGITETEDAVGDAHEMSILCSISTMV